MKILSWNIFMLLNRFLSDFRIYFVLHLDWANILFLDIIYFPLLFPNITELILNYSTYESVYILLVLFINLAVSNMISFIQHK